MKSYNEADYEALLAQKEDRDGYTGEVLDMIHQIFETDGELASDFDCINLIHDLAVHWKSIV